jgi:dolichol-phosphate mannosyltransferase
MAEESLVMCPVYNEGKTLKKFYQLLCQNYQGDVLFVDDGSTDEGRDFLTQIKSKRTHILRHPRRLGYGEALLSGFGFALEKGYKKIVTIDVDLQHSPEQIPQFLDALDSYEVVLGSRYIRLEKVWEVPKQRLLINRYISKLIKVVFGADFSDPFCGFRAYRDSFLEEAKLGEKSYGISLEILLEIFRRNISFLEIPVEAIYFKELRRFLDGLDDPHRRLLYYLEVISRKKREMEDEKIFSSKSSSR